MTIYTPLGSDDYELCHPVADSDFELIRSLINGASHAANWKPVSMKIITVDDRGRRLLRSDAPWLGAHAPVFRDRAIRALHDLLAAFGEVLPLHSPGANIAVYNAKIVSGALDESASSVRRFRSGRLMAITQHVFRPDQIAGVDLFKIPNLRNSPTFVSGRFVERWNDAGLVGLEFEEVWRRQ